MRLRAFFVLLLVFVLPLLAVSAYADTAVLGNAASFAVLGATPNVTNTGATTLVGSLGVSPAASITGLASITVNGAPATGNPATHINDGAAIAAQSSLTAAISGLQGLSSLSLLPGALSGVITINPGVYSSPTTFNLNGTLTLDAKGASNVAFVFLVGSSLTAQAGSVVNLINAGSNVGVYWVTTASASILAGASFVGNILAHTSITLGQGATITCGSALANTGTVTMINNTITNGCQGSLAITPGGTVVTVIGGTTPPPPGTPPVVTPEPGTFALLSSGLALGLLKLRKSR
jgi:hypothetical protein